MNKKIIINSFNTFKTIGGANIAANELSNVREV